MNRRWDHFPGPSGSLRWVFCAEARATEAEAAGVQYTRHLVMPYGELLGSRKLYAYPAARAPEPPRSCGRGNIGIRGGRRSFMYEARATAEETHRARYGTGGARGSSQLLGVHVRLARASQGAGRAFRRGCAAYSALRDGSAAGFQPDGMQRRSSGSISDTQTYSNDEAPTPNSEFMFLAGSNIWMTQLVFRQHAEHPPLDDSMHSQGNDNSMTNIRTAASSEGAGMMYAPSRSNTVVSSRKRAAQAWSSHL
ncbi:hypothetical protein BC628DRAFT_385671 [Trametes gibbosa]|nr:hypothetical protein BC628DRAFT_385671 [Trametes gibbosa]